MLPISVQRATAARTALDLPVLVHPSPTEVLVLLKFLATSVAPSLNGKALRESRKSPTRRVAVVAGVAIGCLASFSASAAIAAPLDGETLTGNAQTRSCGDNGDGTTSLNVLNSFGTATGPVPGTYFGRSGFTYDNATGSVTEYGMSLRIQPDDPQAAPTDVTLELGSGHGTASCSGSDATLNLVGVTYVTDSGGTGVASVSATVIGTSIRTFLAVFGPQAPTTKAQCEKNGWKTFPGFKNQGDCTSYVATKGKNEPSGS
jgi:hypothetical protein